jgi:hypothetical protein
MEEDGLAHHARLLPVPRGTRWEHIGNTLATPMMRVSLCYL